MSVSTTPKTTIWSHKEGKKKNNLRINSVLRAIMQVPHGLFMNSRPFHLRNLKVEPMLSSQCCPEKPHISSQATAFCFQAVTARMEQQIADRGIEVQYINVANYYL